MMTNDDGLRMADSRYDFVGQLLISARLWAEMSFREGPESVISAEGWGWYGLIRAGSFGGGWRGILDRDGFVLTDAESDYLADQVGAILHAAPDGAISVAYYETSRELDAAWNDIIEWCND
jgi:hypothetical protein